VTGPLRAIVQTTLMPFGRPNGPAPVEGLPHATLGGGGGGGVGWFCMVFPYWNKIETAIQKM